MRRRDGDDADGVLPAVRREHQVALVAHERSGHRRQPRDALHEAARGGVDHVDRVVGRVRHEDAPRAAMHGGVIESARARVRRQIDVPDEVEHGYLALLVWSSAAFKPRASLTASSVAQKCM